MKKFLRNAGANFVRAFFTGSREMAPLVPLYHVTPFCNLRCSYCDGLLEKGPEVNGELSTGGVLRVLEMVRAEFDFIFFTGGEPFQRKDIIEIVRHARRLKFGTIAVNTNSLLLPAKEEALRYIDELSISLDMLDAAAYDGVLNVAGAGKQIVENVERYGELQGEYGYTLTVHCVIMPGRIAAAREVLRFCIGRGIKICLSPLVVGYTEHAWFHDNAEYREFIDEIEALKRKTRLISGTRRFLKSIREFHPYTCYPFLIPRIFPSGDILYPCRPLGESGTRVNLLEAGSWRNALRTARAIHGPVKDCARSCRIRCYIEPSLITRFPLSMLSEFFT